MIAKISSGKNFYGAANYNQLKVNNGKANILHSQNLRKTSPKYVQETFNLANRTKIKNPVFHVSLSFSTADKGKLDNEKMLKITQDYIEKMGYGKQPYIVYRHNDTAHPHVHILTSRVDVATQKKLPHDFEHRKSKRITDNLEVKYDLTISDKQVLAKREMLGDLQKAMQNGKPESLKKLNKELSNIGSDIRAKHKGKGIVYYKVGEHAQHVNRSRVGLHIGEKQTTKSVKSSLFKDVGLDKKSLEKEFSNNQKDRLYVKGNVEKVLAKSPKVNAITFARKLQEKGIETEFRYGKDSVIGVKYKYQDHSYKGSTLDRSLSFNKTKEQLDFPDIEQLKLRKNLLDNVQSGKPIDMTYDGKRVFQDLAQLERDYGREVANAIFNTVGNKITGSVVAETAKKLSDMIGKTVQQRANVSYSNRGTTTGKTTTMDYLIPPETIAQLSQGEFCGVLSDTYEQKAEQKIFYSKVIADKGDLTKYPIPILNRVGEVQFTQLLETNLIRIDKEVRYLVNVFLPEIA